jgi:hypothetical protein
LHSSINIVVRPELFIDAFSPLSGGSLSRL